MQFKIKAAALAVASVFPFVVGAQDNSTSLEPVVVTATRVEMADVDAPYASEVHTRTDIERSGTSTLFDYLARYTSVNVQPNYGNRFTPSIDMRGYGVGDGYQNVVISVNGRRLNNIDMQPQLIGAILLDDIERIEITKGSGSVMYGDGAMAGTIQIYTRQRTGVTLEGYVGSHGASGQSISAGYAQERFAISASGDKAYHGGFSKKDPSGNRDSSDMDSWRVGVSGTPVDALRLSLDAGQTRIETRYPRPMTRAQFNQNPAMYPGSGNYNLQHYKSDFWQAGAELDLGSDFMLSFNHSREDKISAFGSRRGADYDYGSSDLALNFSRDGLGLTVGYQRFDGRRKGTGGEKTEKDNQAWFVQSSYEFDRFLVSAGWRTELVEYAHSPVAGAALKADNRLTGWDLGANYRVDDIWSVFTNYNSAFQAPDIDRFFKTDWMTSVTSFNGFIDPAKARTLNLGLNRATDRHRLKATVFYSRLKDEIYYDGTYLGANTNIDRSKKYGFELQNTWLLGERYTASLNYAWTKAIIEREDSGSGRFNGKELPGVSRHSVQAALNVKVGENGNLNLAHSWRSRAYSANDFENAAGRAQRAYNATDVSYRHRFAHDIEVYAAVSNLFEKENGIWMNANRVYPIDFERTWRVGAKISF